MAHLMFLAAKLLALVLASFVHGTMANGVLEVRRKFPIIGRGGKSSDIGVLQTHDRSRHCRRLEAADLPLGGVGADGSGIYYTEIGIGAPAMQYYVQVDTGSSSFWVNGISCRQCPRESSVVSKLTLYDPLESVTSRAVQCDDVFCTSKQSAVQPNCSRSSKCPYYFSYGDGGATAGWFYKDLMHYRQLSGNNGQTQPTNASVIFGCAAQNSGSLNITELAVDGIIGFSNSNNTLLSQLAAAGKTKKIFSHCLDSRNGGGIFAIGEVVEPKVKTTPLANNQSKYHLVNLTSIDVDNTALQIPANIFGTTDSKGTMVDSGTALAYLPGIVYSELMLAIFAKHKNITLRNVDDLECFEYLNSTNDGFPNITFKFQGDLTLDVYPYDYLFEFEDNQYCVGFQDASRNVGMGEDGVVLGEMVISDKLVIYDMENHVIGWTEYNCSSSIKIKDEETGATYTVNANNISSGWIYQWQMHWIMPLVIMVSSYLV
uniref:Peptidase A1 domain-containing protein n=2 Tax=Oryza brachyantha TaxID=4533 RepID=J3LWT7_ORYBR